MSDLFDPEAQRPRLALRASPSSTAPTLPSPEAVGAAAASLPDASSASYLAGAPAEDVFAHIARDIVPALSGQAASSRYYGLVTGGALPLAEWADNVVSRLDQNACLHQPGQSVASTVEDAALGMLAALLRLDGDGDADANLDAAATPTAASTVTAQGNARFKGRTFTTGATASNVLGLACGREAVVAARLHHGSGRDNDDKPPPSVGEMGLLAACRAADISDVRVLTSAGHSSLSKAASAVGLGRASVVELGADDEPWRLDLDAVEAEMRRHPDVAYIVSVSASEVNTGRFALAGRGEWERLRGLADECGAWIHADGAFGIFARALDQTDEFATLHRWLDGIELADSITVDGHKVLNVPYDCGVFYTRAASTLLSVFVNPNAAYLATAESGIPAPLNIGLENSRRFRALPAYAVLRSEGRPGMALLVSNMVRLARRIAAFVRDSDHYELLPEPTQARGAVDMGDLFIIVLFRARRKELNDVLVDRVNETRQMYVSGTSWKGRKAVRIAVSNWRVDLERDFEIVSAILTAVAEGRKFEL